MVGIFVTGTDTGVGKTFITANLLQALRAKGLKVVGMKPVACGCIDLNGQLRNEDALMLLNASNQPVPYDEINLYSFMEPISPNIAARLNDQFIDLHRIRLQLDALSERFDLVVVEGVGGWLTPLSDKSTVADLAKTLALPVLLVIGLKLGCLNHAFLTTSRIALSGSPLLGWVANQIDPNLDRIDDTYRSLCDRISCSIANVVPCLDGLESEDATNWKQKVFDPLATEVLRRLNL